MQPSPTVLIVDRDAARRSIRAASLGARGFDVHEADDTLGALKELPHLRPIVLVVSTAGEALDLETLARGVASMRALEGLQILAIGEARPLSGATQASISLVPEQTTPDEIAKECERLAAKGRRKKG
jgi:CheY-like chemotaxis protein